MGQHRRQTHRSRLWVALGLVLAVIAGLSTAALAATAGSGLDAHQLHLLHERHLHFPGGGDTHHNIKGLTANPDCTLTVPKNPLSAQGLATPYVLNSAGVTCSESDGNEAAFVQATVLDTATGAVSVYDPVVRNAGAAPLPSAPPVPTLPATAVVTIWTGFNGNVLKLTGPGSDQFTQFPQQAYANSPRFFGALNASIGAGRTIVPALGKGADGLNCPTSRDFSIVDQDQSDNNPQTYPAYGVGNASDEKTLDAVDHALGCAPWQAPLLDPVVAGNATVSASGPLQEAQAAAEQGPPAALIPAGDPFTFRHGQPSLFLQDLLRAQVDQVPTFNGNDTAAYCRNLAGAGEARLKADQTFDDAAPHTLPIGDSLGTQLANRFVMTWGNLNCTALTGLTDPITVIIGPDGVAATSATYA